MDLLKSLMPLAAVAGASYLNIGPEGQAAVKEAAAGFVSKGNKAPLRQAPQLRPTKLGQMNLPSRSATNAPVRLNPIQQIMQSEPRVSAAMSELVNNATNKQVTDFFYKYGNISYTAKGGRPQLVQQTDIQV
jgi:uncharacterized protein YgbK (DUF1537 family)